MKTLLSIISGCALVALMACDKVSNPYPKATPTELDQSLYPGNWADYLANEWPAFTTNPNTSRNVLIEDFTGHKCTFCPAAAVIAENLVDAHPGRVMVASIHSGPTGIENFQAVTAAYPEDFTNPQGLEIGRYFGMNDGGFSGNPRGPISRVTNGGNIFQSPNNWVSLTNGLINTNALHVNLQ